MDLLVVDPRRHGVGQELAHERNHPVLLPERNPGKGGEEVVGDGELGGADGAWFMVTE